MEEFRKVLEEAIEALQDNYSAMPNKQEWTGLEIEVKPNEWENSDLRTWRSWTGRRKIWGIEHHGPIYIIDTKDDSTPYTGSRLCKCSICQEHVDPRLKSN
jgi:hypothetical protein